MTSTRVTGGVSTSNVCSITWVQFASIVSIPLPFGMAPLRCQQWITNIRRVSMSIDTVVMLFDTAHLYLLFHAGNTYARVTILTPQGQVPWLAAVDLFAFD